MRAVLFDMDGVLVDSFDTWLGVLHAVAAELGTEPVTDEQLRGAFGQGIEEDTRTFFPGSTPEQLRALYDASMPRYLDRMVANPQALDVLQGLGARGISRAIVTNTQTSLAERILLGCGLREEVDLVSAAEPGVPEKPDPAMLLKACEAFGVRPADALMVGDTDYDEQAAVAAGIPFLHYDLRAGEDLAAALGQG